MLRFRFGLRPVHEIEPWGGERPTLHWFGLTDGWFCIDLREHELLRYAQRTLQRWSAEGPGREVAGPYVDYYVVRLWEDLLEILADVLEPVPADLGDFMAAELPDWLSLDISAPAERAAVWHCARTMPLLPVNAAPVIRWWRTPTADEDIVTVAWRHRHDPEIEFDAPATGRISMPTSAFVAAVDEFDRRLLAAMEERVRHLEATGGLAGIGIDLEQLRREQQDRSQWLQRARDRRCDTDWTAVRTGAQELLAAKAGQ